MLRKAACAVLGPRPGVAGPAFTMAMSDRGARVRHASLGVRAATPLIEPAAAVRRVGGLHFGKGGPAAVLRNWPASCLGRRSLWTSTGLLANSNGEDAESLKRNVNSEAVDWGKQQVGKGKDKAKDWGKLKVAKIKEKAGPTASIFKGKLYDLYKKYGRTAVVTYVGLDLTTLTICYIAVRNGLDVDPIFAWFGVAEWIPDGAAGPMIVAFAFNKLTMPLRWTLTAGLVPTLATKLKARFPTIF